MRYPDRCAAPEIAAKLRQNRHAAVFHLDVGRSLGPAPTGILYTAKQRQSNPPATGAVAYGLTRRRVAVLHGVDADDLRAAKR